MRTAILILLPVLLLAQDPDDAAKQQSSSAVLAAGKSQFQQTCGFCHGSDGRGASGPDLIRSSVLSHDVNGNLIGPIIRNGRPDKGMPAFQLSDSQIRSIAAFLHSQATVAASVSRRIPTEYPLSKLLVGSSARGQEYFSGHCSHCHSVTGDLAHIATKYKPFDLQTRIAFPAGAKPTVTVIDSHGAHFKGDLVYADEFLLTLRDNNGWRHTWSRDTVTAEIHDPLAEHEKLLKTYTDENIHDLFAYLETLK